MPTDKVCRGCHGMFIAPEYQLCESCEYSECPGCGEITWDSSSGIEVKVRGFCARCEVDETKDNAIAASARWAALFRASAS